MKSKISCEISLLFYPSLLPQISLDFTDASDFNTGRETSRKELVFIEHLLYTRSQVDAFILSTIINLLQLRGFPRTSWSKAKNKQQR